MEEWDVTGTQRSKNISSLVGIKGKGLTEVIAAVKERGVSELKVAVSPR